MDGCPLNYCSSSRWLPRSRSETFPVLKAMAPHAHADERAFCTPVFDALACMVSTLAAIANSYGRCYRGAPNAAEE